VGSWLIEFAAFAAVEVINDEADDEPDEEALPGAGGQAGHQQNTEDDAEYGEDGASGDAEAAVTLRLFAAEDEHADGYEDKGEERADVGELGEGANVKQAGWDGDENAGDPGGDGGCAKFFVDLGEHVRQQAVARHGEPNAGLAELEDEYGRDHANDGAEENDETRPV